MTSAAEPILERRAPRLRDSARAFASLERISDLGLAREAFGQLEGCGSVYQSLGFVVGWTQAFAADLAVIVARDEQGEAVALLPLHVRRYGPLRVARFVGDKWSNYPMGLFRTPDAWRRDDVADLLRMAASEAGIDLFAFSNMAAEWALRVNPLMRLAVRASPNAAFSGALPANPTEWLDAHFSRATQKKLRKKARKLDVFGAVSAVRATSGREAQRFLDALFAHKAALARLRSEPDAFAAPEVQDLLRGLADGGVMEMYGLVAGERVAATFGALGFGDRLSGLVVSYDSAPEVAAASPGEWLLIEVVRDAIGRGFRAFDLGVGESRYKSEICEREEPLYDAAFAATRLGALAQPAYFAARASLGALKRRPRLFRLVQRWRQRFGG